MHKTEQFERETLNAYVDGELPRADAARVARAAAQDHAIAAQIATLRELKAAIPEIVPERDLRLPPSGGLPRGPVAFAMAACLTILLATGLLYLFMQPQPVGVRWSQALQAEHYAWAFVKNTGTASIFPANGAAGLLPLDLKAAKLTFVGHQRLSIAGRHVYRTGYEGTRGCRVSLFVYPAAIELDRESFSPSLLVKSWKIQSQGFALMADGMARARFEGLARAVEKALREGAQPDPTMRQRLAQARRTSPPCQA